MKNLKLHIISLSFLIVVISCSEKNKKASIQVHIDGLGNDTAYVCLQTFNKRSAFIFDTIIARNGKFKLDTAIANRHKGSIITNNMYKKYNNGEKALMRSQVINFFIKPEEQIKIKATLNDFTTDYNIAGNILNSQYLQYYKHRSFDYGERVRLFFEIENNYIDGVPDSLLTDLFTKEYTHEKKIEQLEFDFLKSHLDYEITAYLLYWQQSDTIVKYYPMLSESVKQSDYGKALGDKFEQIKKLAPGGIAPDFEYLTLTGDMFRLGEQYDKYIVLDFWGSWCGSCVKGFPHMKEYYEKHNDKLEIIGIACRDKIDDWQSAINEFELPWIQILNTDENDLSSLYAIKGFPTKVIIDPDGKIVNTYLGEVPEFYEKLKELMQ